MRLDKYVQTEFGLRSRTYAENLIKTGRVTVNGAKTVKLALDVKEGDLVKIEDDGYASQGAYKLEAALDAFGLDLTGRRAVDIGCSNGGFTDCLIRRGAASVLAIDVGECALPKNILESGKVNFLRANARELLLDLGKFDFVCSDVSFISNKHILPSIARLLKRNGESIVLVKPQFELGRNSLNKNGIVTSATDRERALNLVKGYAQECGLDICGFIQSPIRFETKNVEYLLYLKNPEEI